MKRFLANACAHESATGLQCLFIYQMRYVRPSCSCFQCTRIMFVMYSVHCTQVQMAYAHTSTYVYVYLTQWAHKGCTTHTVALQPVVLNSTTKQIRRELPQCCCCSLYVRLRIGSVNHERSTVYNIRMSKTPGFVF